MKQSNNNEIDLLLRSFVRQARDEEPSPNKPTSSIESSYLSEHLDADELNSYAEGVIPAPVRARFTEHLADCPRCRRIVAGLTQAAGATRPYETLKEERGLGFWHRFAPFFSPTLLRYAVPALAVGVIIAISMIALRQQRRSGLLAQNQPTYSSAPSSEAGGPTLSLPTNEALPTDEGSPSRSGEESKRSSDPIEKKDVPSEKSEVAEAPKSSAVTNEITSATLAKDSSQSGQAAGVAGARPSYAPEPPLAATPLPRRPMMDEADKMKTIPEAESGVREDQERHREQKKDQPTDTTTSQGSKTGVATFKTRRIEQLPVATGESRSGGTNKNESRDEVETQTVSGRHFRRRGNAWVDTAYKSSRATTNVSRSSEQFRSLIADEPGIRAIAQRLGGEVIVVWNGRAYRIY